MSASCLLGKDLSELFHQKQLLLLETCGGECGESEPKQYIYRPRNQNNELKGVKLICKAAEMGGLLTKRDIFQIAKQNKKTTTKLISAFLR